MHARTRVSIGVVLLSFDASSFAYWLIFVEIGIMFVVCVYTPCLVLSRSL